MQREKKNPSASTPPNTASAFIYARVSTKEQDSEGYSMPAQLKMLHSYVEQRGMDVIQVYSESFTAKEAGRPDFNELVMQAGRLLAQSPDRRVCLVVEKTDRLLRNFRDYVTLKELLAKGLEVHLVKEGSVLSKDSKSQDQFLFGIRTLMAENYINNLSEEVRKGQGEKASNGMWPSSAPIGYKNNRDLKTIEPHPQNGPLVTKAFEWAATGKYTLNALAKKLFEAGLLSRRAGKMLSKSQMERVLANPIYYGEFRWGKTTHEGRHAPLIDKILFDQVQDALFKKSKPQSGRLSFAFTGLMTCGTCGSAITAQQHKKGRLVYYHCTQGQGTCASMAYMRQEELCEALGAAVKRLQVPATVIEWTKADLVAMHASYAAEQKVNIDRVTTRYNQLNGFIDQSYNDKLEGTISSQMWQTKSAGWRKEQEHIQGLLKAYSRADAKSMEQGVRLMEVARDTYGVYQRSTPVQQRQILDFLLLNATLTGKKLSYEYKKPFCWVAEGSSVLKWRS